MVWCKRLSIQLIILVKKSSNFKVSNNHFILQSVLQQATCFNNEKDILTSLQEQHAMANRAPQNQQSLTTCCNNKKQGVSAESSDSTGQPSAIPIQKHDKDFRWIALNFYYTNLILFPLNSKILKFLKTQCVGDTAILLS